MLHRRPRRPSVPWRWRAAYAALAALGALGCLLVGSAVIPSAQPHVTTVASSPQAFATSARDPIHAGLPNGWALTNMEAHAQSGGRWAGTAWVRNETGARRGAVVVLHVNDVVLFGRFGPISPHSTISVPLSSDQMFSLSVVSPGVRFYAATE